MRFPEHGRIECKNQSPRRPAVAFAQVPALQRVVVGNAAITGKGRIAFFFRRPDVLPGAEFRRARACVAIGAPAGHVERTQELAPRLDPEHKRVFLSRMTRAALAQLLHRTDVDFVDDYTTIQAEDCRKPELGVANHVLESISGHLSRRMLEHYSHICIDAKRQPLDALVAARRNAAPNGNGAGDGSKGNAEAPDEDGIDLLVEAPDESRHRLRVAGPRRPVNC